MREPVIPNIRITPVVPVIKLMRSANPDNQQPPVSLDTLTTATIRVKSVPTPEPVDRNESRPLAEESVNQLTELVLAVLFGRGAIDILPTEDVLTYEDGRIYIHGDGSTKLLHVSIYSPTIAESLDIDGDWVTVLHREADGKLVTLKPWITIEPGDRDWVTYVTELADCPGVQQYLECDLEPDPFSDLDPVIETPGSIALLSISTPGSPV